MFLQNSECDSKLFIHRGLRATAVSAITAGQLTDYRAPDDGIIAGVGALSA